MILLGLQMACSSSLEAWTILLVSTTHKQVCSSYAFGTETILTSESGQMVRQIAEHNHYVQGVAWDPLNEFVATQSSDRSVHIYNLKTKDGQFTLNQHNKVTKMDLPGRRIASSSPAPADSNSRPHNSIETSALAPPSPAPSASIPGTPTSLALPMNPPAISHSRRSSFGIESSPSMRRSASPAPSMPLPAVRPMENSPNPYGGLGVKNANIYANETYTSFFRRLTFAPDGSLLFTPAGQYKTSHPSATDGTRNIDDVINTVYIYTRSGFNKPPIAHLPGHKKPSIAVKCSPIYYTHRSTQKPTVHITLDTSSSDEAIPALPDSVVSSAIPGPPSAMDPPPLSMSMPSPGDIGRPTSSPRPPENDSINASTGPVSTFALPYRIVYGVATQDSILIYDTQQHAPLCVVSNLHFATFTDLTWYANPSQFCSHPLTIHQVERWPHTPHELVRWILLQRCICARRAWASLHGHDANSSSSVSGHICFEFRPGLSNAYTNWGFFLRYLCSKARLYDSGTQSVSCWICSPAQSQSVELSVFNRHPVIACADTSRIYSHESHTNPGERTERCCNQFGTHRPSNDHSSHDAHAGFRCGLRER